jgi:hypothetical protein
MLKLGGLETSIVALAGPLGPISVSSAVVEVERDPGVDITTSTTILQDEFPEIVLST